MSVNVAIEGLQFTFYVTKRPYVDDFLDTVCEWFEVIVFTASLRAYANPVIDFLDKKKKIKARLFREVC